MREIRVGSVVRQTVDIVPGEDTFTVLCIVGNVIDTSTSWDHVPALQLIVYYHDDGSIKPMKLKTRYVEKEFRQVGRLILRTEIL